MTRAGHSVRRHWPGEGSVAMAWLVRASEKNRVRSMRWKGRAGSLTLRAEGGAEGSDTKMSRNSMTWVGVHGAHGDLHAASMSDAATLAMTRLRPSSVAVLGDFNADMREPALAHIGSRPPADGPRESERESVQALAEALGLRVCIPEHMSRGPGGGGGI